MRPQGIIRNVIGQTFIGGPLDAGQAHAIKPDSAIYIGPSKNVEISNNTVARGRVIRVPVAVDPTCDRGIHVSNNTPTSAPGIAPPPGATRLAEALKADGL
jgi:hypothetical protein